MPIFKSLEVINALERVSLPPYPQPLLPSEKLLTEKKKAFVLSGNMQKHCKIECKTTNCPYSHISFSDSSENKNNKEEMKNEK